MHLRLLGLKSQRRKISRRSPPVNFFDLLSVFPGMTMQAKIEPVKLMA